MSSRSAFVAGHGRKSLPLRVLRGSLLAACLILGLLLMHGMNLHGTPAAQPSVITAHTMNLDPTAERNPAMPAGGIDDPSAACGDCGSENHLVGAAAACVLALFAALILLLRPSGKILRGQWFMSCWQLPSLIINQRPHTPSLHELCISRT